MRRLLVLAVVTSLSAACTAQTEGRNGADLYQVSCAGCHGDDLGGGRGLTNGPDIGPGSNADLVLSDDQIAGVIQAGPGSMPSFGRVLDEDQIASLVAYIRSVQEG